MKAPTLLLITWLIWITAKGRLKAYWALATTSSGSAPAQSAPGSASDLSQASALPGFGSMSPLPALPTIGNVGGPQ